jgi:plasmid stabilization system protein ParE
MRVRWTTDAADDLERICDYIAESRPESKRKVARSVVERISELRSFPRIGPWARRRHTGDRLFPRFHTSLFTKSLMLKTRYGYFVSCMARNNGHPGRGDIGGVAPGRRFITLYPR